LPVIERFNFYDIYGFLLPGSALLAILWLPFAIGSGSLPVEKLSAAAIAIGFAYIVGHILQTVATNVIPSNMEDTKKQMRAPSDLMLDPSDKNLSGQVKERLAARVLKEFTIDLEIASSGTGTDDISKRREDAFYQCRTFLILKKATVYTEQYEGLYALMRGLCSAFCIGGSYLVGWGASQCHAGQIENVATFVFWLSALCLSILAPWSMSLNPFDPKRKDIDRYLSVSILVLAMVSGWLLGHARASLSPWITWGSAAAACFAATRCYSSYRVYTIHFASSVWRDFAGFSAPGEATSKAGSSG
jgi:hypothetical protein